MSLNVILSKENMENSLLLQATFLCLGTVNKIYLFQISSENKKDLL